MDLIADNGIQMFTQASVDTQDSICGGSWIDENTFVIMTPCEVAEYSNCTKMTQEELKLLGISTTEVDYYKGHSRHYTRASWDENMNTKIIEEYL